MPWSFIPPSITGWNSCTQIRDLSSHGVHTLSTRCPTTPPPPSPTPQFSSVSSTLTRARRYTLARPLDFAVLTRHALVSTHSFATGVHRRPAKTPRAPHHGPCHKSCLSPGPRSRLPGNRGCISMREVWMDGERVGGRAREKREPVCIYVCVLGGVRRDGGVGRDGG